VVAKGAFETVSMKDVFKYGAVYFLGIVVLQTIYAVWAIGNYKISPQNGDLEVDGRGGGDGKTVSLPVDGVSGEQLLMEEKIEEIRQMAKEARRIESEKKGEEDVEDEDFESDEDEEGVVSSRRDEFEKEISERLKNLQNRINSLNFRAKDITSALQIDASEISAAGMDRGVSKKVNEGDEALVFKKKFKFRSPSTNAPNSPKGFPGTQNWKASEAIKRDSASEETAQDCGSEASDQGQMLLEDKQVNDRDAAKQNSVPSEERGRFVDDEFKVIQNDVKNLKEKMETPDMKTDVRNKTSRTDNGNGFDS